MNAEHNTSNLHHLISQGFSDTVLERFWSKVKKTDGCWLWTGAKTVLGYGKLNKSGYRAQTETAHRTSWMIFNGAIPDGLCVLHKCPTGINELCVNPEHLFLGKGHPAGIKYTRPDLDRFLDFISLDENGCWIWNGSKSRNGYANFSIDRGFIQGHTFAYETFIGDIPDNLEIHHKCRIRACVNPNHLELVTHQENCLKDFRKPICSNGHPFVEGSFYVFTRPDGRTHRQCKICAIERAKAHYLKKKAAIKT